LHEGSGWTIDTAGVGLNSKMCLSRDRAILSAGKVCRIKDVVSEFSTIPTLEDFRNFLDVYYENKDSTDEFIYTARSGERTFASGTNCLQFSSGHLNFYAGGSGAQYLKDEVVGPRSPDREFPVSVLAYQLLAMIIQREFKDYNFRENLFGGAYEVGVADKSGFRRLPYTIIDSLCDTNIAIDGAYELQKRNIQRLIFCCPYRNGSVFILAAATETGQMTWYHAQDLESPDREKLSDDVIEGLLLSHNAEFTISLLRHQDVNFAAFNKDFVDIDMLDGDSLSIDVDLDSLQRCELDYIPQGPSKE